MKLSILFIVSLFTSVCQVFAYSLSEDSLKVREKLVLFQDAAKDKHYQEAASHLHWLLENNLKQHVNTYIVGADVLDQLARSEKDANRKKLLVDSLLYVYDLRLKYCGDSANVINRKALASYRYNINGPKPSELLQLMDEAFRLGKTGILDVTLVPYMQTVVMTSNKEKTISQDEILRRYDILMDVIDAKTKLAAKNKKKQDKLIEYKEDIDELLLKVVKVDCEFIHTNLEPKYKVNPTDLNLAKRIFSYMMSANCDKDSLWLKTGEFIYSQEQSFGLAKHLGLQFLLSDNLDKANSFLSASMKYAPTASDSSEIYIYLGSIYLRQNNQIGARSAYRDALRIDSKQLEAFEKIGDLYFNSFNQCAEEKSMADDRLTYLIAYDYYQRAGNKVKMEMAKKLFPSKEEIFLMNYENGKSIQVACWINESTTIRTRD